MKTEQELKEFFGKKIREQREQRKWSQDQLAEKIDVSKNTISKIEKGKTFVHANTLVKIAITFETEVYELLKPECVLPDKPADIIAKYGDDIREAVAAVNNFYMEKMKK
jgi:transcriptional regulator with XRE-family HTH domain